MYSKVILSVNALVAQMVERKTLNLVVVGSIPIEGVFCNVDVYLLYMPISCQYVSATWSRSSVGRAQDS